MIQKQKQKQGFTIVELLIVIVVIGILTTIVIISYTGISQKAVAASMQSDLANSARKLKLYNIEYGSYPALDENNCPTNPVIDTKYCLKFSIGNLKESYTYTKDTFILKIKNGAVVWFIDQNSQPKIANLSLSNSGGGYWQYRRPIIIANSSGGALSDFQIKIEPFSVSTFTVDYDSIRFTKSDGTTELPYWQESNSIYWIKYNGTLSTGDTTIYIYYNNSNAISSSDGDNVFNFFDDFNGSSLDTTKWTPGGSPTLLNGNLLIDSLSENVFSKFIVNATSSITDLRSMRTSTTGYASFTLTTNNCAMTNWWYANAFLYLVKSGSTCNFISDQGANLGNYSANNWYIFKFVNRINSGAHYVDSYVNGSQKTSSYDIGNIDNVSLGAIRFSAHPSSFGGIYNIDYVRVRNYAAIEPTHNAPDIEEAL